MAKAYYGREKTAPRLEPIGEVIESVQQSLSRINTSEAEMVRARVTQLRNALQVIEERRQLVAQALYNIQMLTGLSEDAALQKLFTLPTEILRRLGNI